MKIEAILTKRARKSLAKNQSFSEWFTYKRYFRILPKLNFISYYLNIVAYAVLIIVTVILYASGNKTMGFSLIMPYFMANTFLLMLLKLNI